MLLETLDIKKDDVVIFSRNIFDLEKNFNVIYKDDPQKEPRNISYNEVCRFVNEYTPKNMIVYRLLTNIKDFEIYLSKYGFYLNINGITELIYFDPVFAIKELEDYSEAINYYDLRFRIQQVGLTTLNRKGDLPNFAEIYSIDMEATEAKFQNDMAFAEAIFVFTDRSNAEEKLLKNAKMNEVAAVKESKKLENKFLDKPEPVKESNHERKPEPKKIIEKEKKPPIEKINDHEKNQGIKKVIESPIKVGNENKTVNSNNVETEKEAVPGRKQNKTTKIFDGIKIIQHDISEDKEFDYKQIMKINFKEASVIKKETSTAKKEEPKVSDDVPKKSAKAVPSLINHSSDDEKTFSSLLKNTRSSVESSKSSNADQSEETSMLLDIFKSPTSLNKFLVGRENKTIVLKMKKK